MPVKFGTLELTKVLACQSAFSMQRVRPLFNCARSKINELPKKLKPHFGIVPNVKQHIKGNVLNHRGYKLVICVYLVHVRMMLNSLRGCTANN